MDKAEQTMIDNLNKNTGKNLDQWIQIVRRENFEKHGQIIKFLKEQYSFTHGFANLVATKARGADAGSVENKDELIELQYRNKEHFKAIYAQIISEIEKFPGDFEIAPKKTYVSLRRKKQFATLQPATKTRFEIGINLKGQAASGLLTTITSSSAMCSHKINIARSEDLDQEVFKWIKAAYDGAA